MIEKKFRVIKKAWNAITHNFIFLAIASFVWLLYRTGSKPSRIAYPCQQVALSNAGVLVILLPAFHICRFKKFLGSDDKYIELFKSCLIILGFLISFSIIRFTINEYNINKSIRIYEQSDKGPLGLEDTIGFKAIPSAMLLPSPIRVVSVHDSLASTWAGSGSPHSTMNQSAIDNMVAKGVMELTEKNTPQEAWEHLIPYSTGEAVVIKLNFNNAGSGCSSGWTSDHYMNPYAELVISVINGLKSIGVPSEKIWLTDPSRLVVDAFRNRINDPNIQYYTKCSSADIGGRSNVFTTDFVNDDSPFSTQTEARPGVFLRVNPAQVFVDADHIINMPQLKGHGGASTTLGLKNHFGSVSFTENAWGGTPLHQYFYTNASHDTSQYNLLGDISDNPVFRDKTRLIIGDGLMGHSTINYQPPHTWNSFGGSPPEILFFSVDPVAVDSVMTDYLNRENLARSEPLRGDNLLIYASSIGLGVFEHWDGPDTRNYSGAGLGIDYVEVDFDNGLCKNCYVSIVEEGQTVNIVIKGLDCAGGAVNIEYYEVDKGSRERISDGSYNLPSSGTFTEEVTKISWTTEWFEDAGGEDPDPEIQFIVKAQGSSYESDILKIGKQ